MDVWQSHHVPKLLPQIWKLSAMYLCAVALQVPFTETKRPKLVPAWQCPLYKVRCMKQMVCQCWSGPRPPHTASVPDLTNALGVEKANPCKHNPKSRKKVSQKHEGYLLNQSLDQQAHIGVMVMCAQISGFTLYVWCQCLNLECHVLNILLFPCYLDILMIFILKAQGFFSFYV